MPAFDGSVVLDLETDAGRYVIGTSIASASHVQSV
jgi:hypothetical protein